MSGNITAGKNQVDANSTASLFALLLCCFFISGLTGLTYEILWTRMIVKIIGSAPFAVSIVLTVFMGGLGLGSFLAGRIVDRVDKPLKLVRIYGLLEIGIAVYGLALPLLLIFFKPIYAVIYNSLFQYFFTYSLFTFVGCALLLIVPVTFMGATLPVLSRFFVTSLSKVGTHVGRLYGLNTIGAAAGSLLCGFWLINTLGVWGALSFAILLNTFIGAVCIFLSKRWTPFFDAHQQSSGSIETIESRDHGPAKPVGKKAEPVWQALTIFAVSGFCAMAYEVIWVKLLGLLVGPTTYSFTIVLVTFITGLALGSIFFGWLVDQIKKPTLLLLTTQMTAALSALLISQLIGNGQIFFSMLIQRFQDNFAVLMMTQSAVLFLFMFFPTFCLGATFPLVGKIYTRSLAKTGRSIGYAYAVNTVGAVLGSFCAGFILIPFVGKEMGIRIIVGFQLVTNLVIWFVLALQSGNRYRSVIPASFLAGFILFMALSPYPQWNRLMLSKGKYHRFDQIKQRDMGWMEALLNGTEVYAQDQTQILAYYGDGIGGFTSVLKTPPDILGRTHYSLLNSGKADASSQRGDMNTQTLLAHFPMLFHPNPKNVLVLGLASGITAGEALYYPIDRLDAIEINRQVIAASDYFKPWNNHVLSNSKTELIIQDGRAHLALTDRKYDVIISEPSNPWMAGLASLFTLEFMELARDRLNDNGIFVQWIHSYQMNWHTFSMVGRTFATVFPNGILVSTNPRSVLYGPDFLLVGVKGGKVLDLKAATHNLHYAQKSTNMRLMSAELLYNLLAGEDLRKLFGPGPINTDNRPWLEFSAPKLLHFTRSAEEIAEKIQTRTYLNPETADIIRKNRSDMDRLIDFQAFRLAYNITGEKMLEMQKATASQKNRYYLLLEEYCSDNPVHNFSFITDPALRQRCVLAHLKRVEKRFSTANDKLSLCYYMGWICNQNGMPYRAVQYFFKALSYAPKNGKANDALAKLLKTKDPQTMFALTQRELAAQPENPAIHYHMGNIYLQYGNPAAARNHFYKSLSLDQTFLPPINRLISIAIAELNYKEAIDLYKKIIAVDPDQPSLYYNIACLYSRQHDQPNSLKWLKTALDKGFDKWDLIETDRDLALIRQSQAYRELIQNSKQM